jgi:ankyrin repeat protein
MLYANHPTATTGYVTAPSYGADEIVKPQPEAKLHVVVEKPPPAPQSPVEFLREMFYKNCYGGALLADLDDNLSFNRPSKAAIDAYDLGVVQAIRYNDMDRLRALLREGKSFNACNRFGESLMHMVCRRGNVEIANFLIKEAGVDVDVRDDFGRTPLHDACWTSKPNVAIMDLLLDHVSPELLLVEDVRGHTPFQYARKEHYEEWLNYLKDKEEDLQRRITTYGMMR